MADLKSRKAKFDDVKQDMSALKFHKDRYEGGSVDNLAKQCYQYWQVMKTRPGYEDYFNGLDEE